MDTTADIIVHVGMLDGQVNGCSAVGLLKILTRLSKDVGGLDGDVRCPGTWRDDNAGSARGIAKSKISSFSKRLLLRPDDVNPNSARRAGIGEGWFDRKLP